MPKSPMTTNFHPREARRRGMTLLEITLVIATLLVLISALFAGSISWRRGSDRSVCILTMRNMQLATRSYQNLYGFGYGARPADSGDITTQLHHQNFITLKAYNQAIGLVPCQGGGIYTCSNSERFPEPGELYMTCSLASLSSHEPQEHSDW